MYRIHILLDGEWQDCPEDVTYDCYEDALSFAEAEIGVPWRIMEWVDDRIAGTGRWSCVNGPDFPVSRLTG